MNVYLLHKTNIWFGFIDLDPIVKFTGGFLTKIRIESVDGFHLTWVWLVGCFGA